MGKHTLLGLATAGMLAGCSGDISSSAGTAGGPSNGGAAASGGLPGNVAGATTTGGATSTGGAESVGGATTGGTATGGANTGGNSTGGGSTGGAANGGTGGACADGAYYGSNAWAGCVWIAAGGVGTTTSPADFNTHTAGTPFCVSGNVGPMTDYSGFAMIGLNLDQPLASGVVGEWTPTTLPTGGVQVGVTNHGASALRVQITGPNGMTDANDRWCYDLGTVSGAISIRWTSFNTACWSGGSGVAYTGTSLTTVSVLVPGGNASATPYDFCVSSLAAY
jgi:hypothetical protein